jgi:addiction module HigA family antidote
VSEERSVTADTALRLTKHFETTTEFWLNLQMDDSSVRKKPKEA